MAPVDASQRFTRDHPCPVCGGHAALPQGQARRCHGFLSADGRYAHCAREEYAGAIQPGPDGLYAHFLEGDCRCGRSHQAAFLIGEKRANAKDPPAKQAVNRASERRFEVRDVDGQLHAVHVRHDKRDGSKAFTWELPDGTKNLGGRCVETLPLYGSQRLRDLSDGTVVVVTEGEKACEALLARGVAAVGTVTGAKVTPGDEALRPLRRFRVVLWPDNDADGAEHMRRIAVRLHSMGSQPRIVNWLGAPPKGDAADYGGSDDELRQLLDMAEAWAPLVIDPGRLLDEVQAFLSRYVAVDSHALTAAALWVAHTWALDAADATPYVWITSAEKRSGKTRLLEALSCLVAKPWLTGRITAAVLVRKMDRDVPTLLLDESDAAFRGEKEYAEALRGVLNAGHRRGGVASLCVKRGGDFDLRDFSVFGPKVIAGIGRLPDTVADRAIRILLRRRAPGELVARFRLREAERSAEDIRKTLETWAAQAVASLKEARPELPEELDDRAADGWEPLFTIADLAGGNWPLIARNAALALSAGDGREDDSLGVRLLHDIRAVFEEKGAERLASGALAGELQRIEESPWGDLRGKALDARSLARLLRPYEIRPHAVRDGAEVFKGYTVADFEDAFTRYLPGTVTTVTNASAESDLVDPRVTDVTVNPDTGENDPQSDGLFANDPVACHVCGVLDPDPSFDATGRPVCAEHAAGDSAGGSSPQAAVVLTRAHELGWPRLRFSAVETIIGGEDAWRCFASCATPERLQLAWETMDGDAF